MKYFQDTFITIGITGHRDIPPEDETSLKFAIHKTFSKIQAEYPNQKPLLLSGLAEGADRLAVKVAYDMGIGYAAILPLPPNDYRTDFESETSRQDFNQWMDKADWIEVLTNPDTDTQGDNARDRCYQQLGIYLATHSNILIALWDGVLLEKIGGTSQVGRFFREGIPAGLEFLSSPEPKTQRHSLYHIMTRRISSPDAVSQEQVGRVQRFRIDR
jgi:hypothetical protein